MTGIWVAGRRDLNMEYYKGGVELQVLGAGAGAMPIVREVVGKGVTGDASPNPAGRSKRGVGIKGQRGRRGQQSQNLQIGFSCEGRT